MAEVYSQIPSSGRKTPEPTKEQIEREESNAKFAAARARKETALAELREAESKRRAGELIEKSVAVRQASYLFVTIRQRLLAMPSVLARKINTPDRHATRMLIDSEIRAALTELAELPNVITRGQYEVPEAENGEKRPGKRRTPALKASKTG